MSDKEPKLVYGVGINDAGYVVCKSEIIGYVNGKQKQKNVWRCPFYTKWVGMLERCYSIKSNLKRPTYIGCSVSTEWHLFSTFKAWMETQDWKGKQLDKDILFPNNKVYSSDTCVFVDTKVNVFITDRTKKRGEWPIGTYFNKRAGKWQAMCCSVTTGKQTHLGYFTDPEEAHQAWLAFKLEQAYILAEQQTDERVAKALIDRYENFAKAA